MPHVALKTCQMLQLAKKLELKWDKSGTIKYFWWWRTWKNFNDFKETNHSS